MTFHLVASLQTPGHFRTASAAPARRPARHVRRRALPRLGPHGRRGRPGRDLPRRRPRRSPPTSARSRPTASTRWCSSATCWPAPSGSADWSPPRRRTTRRTTLARRFQSLDLVTGGRAAVNIDDRTTPPPRRTSARPSRWTSRPATGAPTSSCPSSPGCGTAGSPRRSTPTRRPGGTPTPPASTVPPTRASSSRSPVHCRCHGLQGRPVVVQAGGSEGGLRLAGDFADVVFTVAQTRAKAVAFRDDVHARAVAAGRSAGQVKVSLGVIVLVADSEEDAARRTGGAVRHAADRRPGPLDPRRPRPSRPCAR